MPEATVENTTLKALIAEVEDKQPNGEMFDAKITPLSEYVKHHVKGRAGSNVYKSQS